MCLTKKIHISQPLLQMEWPMRFKWTKWGIFSGKDIKEDLALLSKTFKKPPKKVKRKPLR